MYVLLLNANKAVPNSNKECYHFVPLIDHMTLRAFSLETWRASIGNQAAIKGQKYKKNKIKSASREITCLPMSQFCRP